MEPAGSPSTASTPNLRPAFIRNAAEALSDDTDVNFSTCVFYIQKGRTSFNFQLEESLAEKGEVLRCDDFDDLLDLLETDVITEIIFDSSVSRQEVQYITRWAHIFKPAIHCSGCGTPGYSAFIASSQI
jgi:hypothetical protein